MPDALYYEIHRWCCGKACGHAYDRRTSYIASYSYAVNVYNKDPTKCQPKYTEGSLGKGRNFYSSDQSTHESDDLRLDLNYSLEWLLGN